MPRKVQRMQKSKVSMLTTRLAIRLFCIWLSWAEFDVYGKQPLTHRLLSDLVISLSLKNQSK